MLIGLPTNQQLIADHWENHVCYLILLTTIIIETHVHIQMWLIQPTPEDISNLKVAKTSDN